MFEINFFFRDFLEIALPWNRLLNKRSLLIFLALDSLFFKGITDYDLLQIVFYFHHSLLKFIRKCRVTWFPKIYLTRASKSGHNNRNFVVWVRSTGQPISLKHKTLMQHNKSHYATNFYLIQTEIVIKIVIKIFCMISRRQ